MTEIDPIRFVLQSCFGRARYGVRRRLALLSGTATRPY